MMGWFLESLQPLPATLFSQFLIGFGMMMVFSGTSNYLIDLYPTKSASVIACNNCIRTIAAAIATALSSKIINSLGFAWSFTTFAFLQFPGIIGAIYLLLWSR